MRFKYLFMVLMLCAGAVQGEESKVLSQTLVTTFSAHYIKNTKYTPDGSWNTYTHRDTFRVGNDTIVITYTSPGSGNSVARTCDSMVFKINANATLAAVLTAYDSTTYYHVKNDDSSTLFDALGVDSGQTKAVTTPSVVRYFDTTIIDLVRDLHNYDGIWFGLEYDIMKDSMAAESLIVTLQRSVDPVYNEASTLRCDTIVGDSTLSTSGWNLEKYLKRETAGDSTLRYDYARLRIIDQKHLSDTGSSLAQRKDSSYVHTVYIRVKGVKGEF